MTSLPPLRRQDRTRHIGDRLKSAAAYGKRDELVQD